MPNNSNVYNIKSSPPWKSQAVLANVTRDSIELDPEFVNRLEPALWTELVTEYDAEHFCEYLRRREAAGKLRLSGMFSEFERVWRRDELNHVHGFALLYSVLYSITEEELFVKLQDREPDFSGIELFLEDEFAICVALAYDEIATAKSYQHDMMHRYPKFRNQALIDWIKLVARDEVWHFENAINIIKMNHSHRIPAIPSFLSRLVSFDASGAEYGATFILDHGENNYDQAFLEACRSAVLQRLS